MNNKKIEKPAAAFEIITNKNVKRTYSVKCVIIEQGKAKMLNCATKIPDKKTAEFLHKMIERYWNTRNKIIRFYDNPKNPKIKLTEYCEIRPLIELETIIEQYNKKKTSKVEDKSKNEIKLPVDLEYLKKYVAQIERMKCPKCGKPLRLIESGHPQYKNEIAFTCTGYEKHKTAENNCRFLIPVTPLSYKIHKDKIEEFMYEHPSAYIAYSKWSDWED